MIRTISLIFLFSITLQMMFSQTFSGESSISQGLNEMKNGQFESAASSFRSIINNDSLQSYYPEALYWLVKADIVIGKYNEALNAADVFLRDYPEHSNAEEIIYQRGRLYFLDNNPDEAIVALGAFIQGYPSSQFISSSFYWIGESLMALGHLERADAVFSELLDDYPSSVKREAASYRRREISLRYRERELLDLLKWSHEEYLRDSEDFYRRETEYLRIIDDFNSRLSNKDRELLLTNKERMLEVKAFYIGELLRLYNEQ